MKRKAVLLGLFLVLALSSMSFKCDGDSATGVPDPWRRAAKAADDIAISINTMIKTKRTLGQQGTITPAEELALTNALLKANTADKALVTEIKKLKSAADVNAQKPNLCSLFGTVASSLTDLNATGLVPISNSNAKTQLATILAAMNASAAIIAGQCQ